MKNYSERFPTKTRKVGEGTLNSEKRRLEREYQNREADEEIRQYKESKPTFPDKNDQ